MTTVTTRRSLASSLSNSLARAAAHVRTRAVKLAAFALLVLAGSQAWAQQVVISQIYGGGANTGATYNRDYVELHNRGATSASVAGWSVQYASSTGSTWSRVNITAGSIAPGGYFLIQMTTSGTVGAALPTPDATATTAVDMAAASGKVALVSNQTTLPSQIGFVLGTSGVVDFVGFGQTSATAGPNAFEGTGGTPGAGSATLAIYRANSGCTDTHNNATDFLAPALPAPRNSASPVFNCTATGACCSGASCTYVDSASCTGSYEGDFSLCGTVAYPAPTSPANALDDISATGTAITALDNADDSASTVAISPAFNFFGNARSQISIGTNGYLTFLPGTTATSAGTGVTIPTAATPNDMIAAMRMDLVVRTTLVPGAHIYTQQKSSPNRFIIQWNKVSTFSASTVTPDNFTFQAILNQDTGEVEFRYGAMNTSATTPAYAANTGLEDQSGTVGSTFSGGSFAALANTARLFTPSGASTCSPPVNDNCTSATTIGAAGTGLGGVSGTNVLATLDGGASGCSVPVSKDVWFAFQPGISGGWDIRTCGTVQDTVLEVYDACGGNLVACDDDSCGTASTLSTSLVSSNSYRIRVCSKGAAAAGGAYTLIVTPTPPANDTCAGAVVITSVPFTAVTSDCNGPAATNDIDVTCNSSTPTQTTSGVWFTYTPAVSGNMALNQTSTNDTVVAVFTGSCAGLTQVACSDPNALSVPVTAGTQYWILVGMWGTTAPTTAYGLTVDLVAPPVNDTCATAAVIASTPYTAPANTCNGPGATNDVDVTCNSSTPTQTISGVWFTYTATQTGSLDLTQTSSNDTVLAVFTGSCGSLTQIACSDPNTLSVPVTSGTQYWILVGMWGSTAPGTNYGLTASFTAPVVNDACSGAIALAIPSVTPGTTVGATVESPAPPACAGPLPGGSQSYTLGTSPGIWYTVTSPVNQTITADTFASAYDSRLFVYDGSAGCGSLVCVTANDDAQGSPFQSRAAWVATAGVPYYILVTPFTTTTGTFTLTVSGDATPANDSCASATPISGISGSIGGTTIGATALNNTATTANPSCNPSYAMFDVWYSWTAPCSGTATLATCGTFDTVLSVHTACADLTTSNQVSGACNDNGASGCTPGSSLTVAVTGGVTYLVRVATATNLAGNGNFTLTWSLPDTDGDGVSDSCDGCPLDPTKIAPGQCGCGVPDTDSDGDGTANCNDGCPNDPLKIAPGVCGCGWPDTDTDGDGTPDCNDQCPNDPNKVLPGLRLRRLGRRLRRRRHGRLPRRLPQRSAQDRAGRLRLRHARHRHRRRRHAGLQRPVPERPEQGPAGRVRLRRPRHGHGR